MTKKGPRTKKREGFVLQPANARELAFLVLVEYARTGEFANRILNRLAHSADITPADRRLATEMTSGIIRRQATIDVLLRNAVSRPRNRIEDALWTLLQVGAYQIVFLQGIPDHAAVSETVGICRRIGRPMWTGFANGVLRSLASDRIDEFTDQPATDSIPLSGGRYLKWKQPLFADPDGEPADYFCKAFSYPRWLTKRWLQRLGRDRLFELGFWFNEPHGVTLRVNPLRTTREKLLANLQGAGYEAAVGDRSSAIRLPGGSSVTELPGFSEGQFTVQDESAMGAAELLAPQPGETVLDLCAAPGTKTTHMAELMQNRGRIVACDVSAERLKLVPENTSRLGLTIIEPTQIAADLSDVPGGPFDAALVDAPCSNTGVLGKRPESRWRLKQSELQELAALQLSLLQAAAKSLKPGGRIVYSTCSIEPEENEQVVVAFLRRNSRFDLQRQIAAEPGRPADGGFLALLVSARA